VAGKQRARRINKPPYLPPPEGLGGSASGGSWAACTHPFHAQNRRGGCDSPTLYSVPSVFGAARYHERWAQDPADRRRYGG
jgi:hypothetical protein